MMLHHLHWGASIGAQQCDIAQFQRRITITWLFVHYLLSIPDPKSEPNQRVCKMISPWTYWTILVMVISWYDEGKYYNWQQKMALHNVFDEPIDNIIHSSIQFEHQNYVQGALQRV